MLYFSMKARAFYDSAIHAAIPDDAKEISAEAHRGLLDAQSGGCEIDWSGDFPVAVVPVLSDADLAANARAQRDALLSACDWTQLSDSGVDTKAWRAYRRALRDITEQPGFPSSIVWPTAP